MTYGSLIGVMGKVDGCAGGYRLLGWSGRLTVMVTLRGRLKDLREGGLPGRGSGMWRGPNVSAGCLM